MYLNPFFHSRVQLKFTIQNFEKEKALIEKHAADRIQKRARAVQTRQFYPAYRFNNFIVGDNNELAYSTAFAVAESPAKNAFNPLVLFGPTGLGKTHLLQAIGRRAAEKMTARRPIYCTSEQFLNDYVRHIKVRKDSSNYFEKYGDCDLLLLDDFQFFCQ